MFKIFLLISLFINSLFAFESKQIDLSSSKWEYRWGDSSFSNNTPVWTLDKDNLNWKEILFPSNPPDRNNQTNVWYRVQLTDNLPSDANL